MLFIKYILPYVSVCVFLLGMACKLHRWLKAPSLFPVTVFPAPGSSSGRLAVFLKEVLLFNSLYLHSRLLWLLSWTMHLSLGVIFAGHLAGIYFSGEQFVFLGISREKSLLLSNSLGMAAGVVLVVSLLGLALRRIFDAEAKAATLPSGCFELALLTGIALTGIGLRLTIDEAGLAEIRAYLAGLILFRPADFPVFPWFFWHFVLANVLLMYIPFANLKHWLGVWIVRLMLIEPPPVYPTAAGKPLRSPFAAPLKGDFQRNRLAAGNKVR
ncbi:hypothetical membrane protein [Pelotomaculum thermopropionicum SI]|uniref:Hypothetical membrane protein n=1 Tax=Pelotomaculum thermopropionicum (strain DSM 13744 / JCM 10971 / SI) TaxID=370438 RepID=A5D4H3_PELTS|nr:hypothetical membrane protein [Pelotomaculum thermopropionicum SI]